MSIPLLSTKFNIPPVGSKVVHRPRLLRNLAAGLEKNTSLTLVCGPAGYDKTTIVCDWLRSLAESYSNSVAWLRFVRRDIRLSGEGNWRLPLLSKRKRTA